MRRLLMIVPVAGLAFAGFAPAKAAPLTDGVPSVITCVGTGGYYDDPSWGESWRFQPERIETPGPGLLADNPACAVWSSDTASAPPIDTPPLDPVGIALWLASKNAVVPVGHHLNTDRISAGGSFACGYGTLSSDEGVFEGSYADNTLLWFHGFFARPIPLDWSATLSDGVGTITGTANLQDGRTRDVTGTIVIDDGAATGECDDSAYNSDVLLTFILS